METKSVEAVNLWDKNKWRQLGPGMTRIIRLRDICRIGGILGMGKNKKEMRNCMAK